ncbi:glycosyltransferase [Candidatus Dependentiae bacterium]|jgi:glycosyltransferase involved in cell wall biosynthesis|nr:glycosyltransferase [Candidatus Dependentiae bacterium]
MQKYLFVSLLALLPLSIPSALLSYDINLIGFLNDIQSISRHTSSFISCLPDTDSIKLFQTNKCSPKDLTAAQKKILQHSIDLKDKFNLSQLINNGLRLSGITICTEHWWNKTNWRAYKAIPDDSIIKYHYCVTERTKLASEWIAKLNSNFDALIVADDWLIDIYKSSGVKLPIFTLPLALDLHSLLSRPIKRSVKKHFTFGFSGIFYPRKNQKLLINAFHEEFKNEPNVQLVLQGRHTGASYIKEIQDLLSSLNNKNITIIQKKFSRQEYENFLAKIDCYVLLSKGEGFSITPREALALGTPCILSNNTAHKVICESGCAYPVAANIIRSSFCYITGHYLGHDFNCTIKDARKALREVYENYNRYTEQAKHGRAWVQQYLPENLSTKYLNLVKPKKVILGNENKITENYLMTNSKVIFGKYRKLCGSSDTLFEVAK